MSWKINHIPFATGDPMKISPSNTEQGYVLRRLIRRIIRLFKKAGINENYLCKLSRVIIEQYGPVYPELGKNSEFIKLHENVIPNLYIFPTLT